MKKESKNYLPLIVDIETLLRDQGIKFRSNSNELVMNECWNCARAKKMYVSKENGVFYCQRCNVTGGPAQLLHKYLGMPYKEANLLLYGKGQKHQVSISKLREEEEKFVEAHQAAPLMGLDKLMKNYDPQLPPPLDIAPELKLLTEKESEAWNYLLKRGYTPEIIKALKILILPYPDFTQAWAAISNRLGLNVGLEKAKILLNQIKQAQDSKNWRERKELQTQLRDQNQKNEVVKTAVKKIARYHGRVIFPVYYNNLVYGLVARDYTGTKEPKVLNSEGDFRANFVWNFDNAKNSEILVVAEGTSSAIKCGIYRSIALLGKVATSGQIKMIKKMKAKKLYLCLDLNTEAEQNSIFQTLSLDYTNSIYQIKFPPTLLAKQDLDKELVKKINSAFRISLEANETNTEYLLLPEEKDKLKKALQTNRAKFQKDFTVEQLDLIEQLATKWEYKDAGDYSLEQMEQFIAQAPRFRGGPRL